MLTCALGFAVFVMAAMIDYAEARYVMAVNGRQAHRAALWSLLQYAIGAVGFVVVVKVSLWLMVPEGLGLFVGTLVALSDDLRAPQAVARYVHDSGPPDRHRHTGAADPT